MLLTSCRCSSRNDTNACVHADVGDLGGGDMGMGPDTNGVLRGVAVVVTVAAAPPPAVIVVEVDVAGTLEPRIGLGCGSGGGGGARRVPARACVSEPGAGVAGGVGTATTACVRQTVVKVVRS